MKRNLLLTFTDETEWATVLEALRRRSEKRIATAQDDRSGALTRASKIAALCREFLDAPQAAKNGEAKP